MCITCVRVILIDAMVVVGLADVVDTVVVVVVDMAVVVTVVLVVVLVVVFSTGNTGNVGPLDVVSTGNSNRPNVCGDAGLCSGFCRKSSHFFGAGGEGGS